MTTNDETRRELMLVRATRCIMWTREGRTISGQMVYRASRGLRTWDCRALKSAGFVGRVWTLDDGRTVKGWA